MKTLTAIYLACAIALAVGFAHLLTAATLPINRAVPVSSVAPEVCEGQGAIQSANRNGELITVVCRSGFVALVSR